MSEKTKKTLETASEVLGGIVLVAIAVAVCWLCCAASGYHFE